MKKELRKVLEKRGINLARNSHTLGLTSEKLVLELLNSLRPKNNGHTLVRIGGLGDGGYLIPNDLVGIEECFSPGSNLLWEFERAIANDYQIKSYICDSISEKPSDLTAMQDFTEAWVGPFSDGGKLLSMQDWVEQKSESKNDLLLQMDIEGAEFQTLLSIPTNLLKRFRIIVLEVHFLEAVKNRWAFEHLYQPFFEKILCDHDLVHLHPNNCCGTWTLGSIEYPRIVELTLHRKDRALEYSTLLTSKNDLDSPCVPTNGDLELDFAGLPTSIKIIAKK
jgi:hypothetical protein